MRTRLLCLACLGAIFFPFVVVAQDVTYDYAFDAKYSQFKTYKWVNAGDSSTPDQFADRNIRQAIEAQLESKGLTQSNEAHLLIDYQLIVTHEKRTTWFSSGGDWWYGPGWGYGAGWPYGYGVVYGGPSVGTATTSTVPVRNIVLEMYDATDKRLVWRGEIARMPDRSTDPEKSRKRLNKAMAKLLKYYPPKAKK